LVWGTLRAWRGKRSALPIARWLYDKYTPHSGFPRCTIDDPKA
jgi:hypothetical protein